MKKSILIIVDAQYDFINGSLAVNGAQEKMDALAEYLKKVGSEYYDNIIMTADWHPKNHMSFKENGGQWPSHCVQGTEGASIYKPLMIAANTNQNVFLLFKGKNKDKEEYSALQDENSKYVAMSIITRYYLVPSDDTKVTIDICGIAGDYCVLETTKDLISALSDYKERKTRINVLLDYTASISSDAKLKELVESYNKELDE
jgi:nicotinamidase/pyrazinamidase